MVLASETLVRCVRQPENMVLAVTTLVRSVLPESFICECSNEDCELLKSLLIQQHSFVMEQIRNAYEYSNYKPIEQAHKVKKDGFVLENKRPMFLELCIN